MHGGASGRLCICAIHICRIPASSAATIEEKTSTISECEIDGVYAANSWKFIDSKRNLEYPDRMFTSC